MKWKAEVGMVSMLNAADILLETQFDNRESLPKAFSEKQRLQWNALQGEREKKIEQIQEGNALKAWQTLQMGNSWSTT